MAVFETHYETSKITMLYEGDDRPCMLSISFLPAGIVTFEGEFQKAKMLSAQLRDSLGLAPAIIVLDYWHISPNSELWDLNHSRPYVRLEVMARDEFYQDEANKPDDGYRLLDRTGWCNYEGGANFYLYERIEDMTLWMGETASPGCGVEPYDNELVSVRYGAWLEMQAEFDSRDAFEY